MMEELSAKSGYTGTSVERKELNSWIKTKDYFITFAETMSAAIIIDNRDDMKEQVRIIYNNFAKELGC